MRASHSPESTLRRRLESVLRKSLLIRYQILAAKSILEEPLNGRDPVAYSYHGKR